MNVIVVGCGRVGAQLADRLCHKGHRVTVMDQAPSAFDNLPASFRGRTVEGQVLDREVLERAGIADADGLAAVTSSDAVNAVIGHMARTKYRVSNVVARNYDSRYAWLLETAGVQAISSTRWGARRFEEILSESKVHTVFSAGAGEVRVYELVVPRSWSGRTVAELTRDLLVQVVALTRAGTASLPTADAQMAMGDIVHVSCTPEAVARLQSRLDGET